MVQMKGTDVTRDHKLTPSDLWIIVSKWHVLSREQCVKMKISLGIGSPFLGNLEDR